MLRAVGSALRGIAARTVGTSVTNSVVSKCNPVVEHMQYRGFGALSIIAQKWAAMEPTQHRMLLNHVAVGDQMAVPVQPVAVPVRTLTKASMTKGKRKTVKTVLKRFYRLHWGIWIRTKAGRHSKLWKKSWKRKKRLRQHVFCNSTQSMLLDKMTTSYWKRRHYYVDDPYEPYHEREEFLLTRKKPLP
ncbi:hypothetical protein DMN91_004676 [Ooceraea biroi]|uniref:Large ribosomal subunit protein bL35m n=1 Tax=Ooceraea biroi TaxID=2015173 RepID=A0A026WB18_OOCBI|nr:39S ribosomal protein L35, mitochondrial [Ooceraea biroi]EZA53255.1 39S ribosomal protein L35, mitochondrial [Ooceraea biroi]RLU22398.1 hypothetical protein DMN91_004676 [Ooceraea biroi]